MYLPLFQEGKGKGKGKGKSEDESAPTEEETPKSS